MEKVLFYLEVVETEKQRNILVPLLVFLEHMINLILEVIEGSLNKLEEKEEVEVIEIVIFFRDEIIGIFFFK
jgi:hypothetical protein